jgi:hypothetical protein
MQRRSFVTAIIPNEIPNSRHSFFYNRLVHSQQTIDFPLAFPRIGTVNHTPTGDRHSFDDTYILYHDERHFIGIEFRSLRMITIPNCIATVVLAWFRCLFSLFGFWYIGGLGSKTVDGSRFPSGKKRGIVFVIGFYGVLWLHWAAFTSGYCSILLHTLLCWIVCGGEEGSNRAHRVMDRSGCGIPSN